MNILALVEAEDHVCCRYRISAFRPHWEAAGHKLTIRELPRGIWARLRALAAVGSADVVVLQRKLLSRVEVALLRRHARRLVFDFDDALWLRDSHSGKGFESSKRRRRFLAIVRAADAVVAGNSILAAEAGARATVIPTCINLDSYSVPVPGYSRGGTGFQPVLQSDCGQARSLSYNCIAKMSGAIQLVWIGSSSTLKGLELQRELWEAIGRAIPGLRLKVICDRFPHFANLPVDAVPWNEATEVEELAGADIGVAWVPDDPWSRGKCALKLLQYHAAGLPVVANPVGVQAEIVRPGDNGFLATTPEEWIRSIRTLVNDADLRKRLGTAGREQVRAAYSVDVGAAQWLEQLGKGAPC